MSRILTVIITVLLSSMLLMWTGPAIETRFFPVYSKFVVETAEATDDGTVATFRFTKYRNCEPRGWAWYLGNFGAVSRQVEVKIEQPSVNRPIGESVSSPYTIAASPEDVRELMFAEVFSYCHPFWLTRSVVYP